VNAAFITSRLAYDALLLEPLDLFQMDNNTLKELCIQFNLNHQEIMNLTMKITDDLESQDSST
jgi:hypothetical protein